MLLFTVVFDALGVGFTLPFGVIYLHEVRDLPLATVGILLAVPAAVALALLGPIGWVIDHHGPRRLQMLALLTSLAGSTTLAFADSAGKAAVAYALLGTGHAVLWPASQSLVASVLPTEIRQRYYGTSFTVLNLGIGLGGLAAGFFVSTEQTWTFQTLYLLNAVSFLAPLGVLARPLRHVGNAVVHHGDSAVRDGQHGGYRAVLADRSFRRLLVVVLCAGFVCYAQVEAGWTAYARTVAQVSTRAIGLAFAANTATIVLLQLVVVQRIEGRRRTRVLMLMAGTLAVCWVTVGLAGLVPGTVIATVLVALSMSVMGVAETLQSPVIPAITNDLAPAHLSGRYNALASFVFQAAAVIGPISAGLLLGHGWRASFIVILLVGCAVMVLVLLRLERVLPPAANGLHPGPVPPATSEEPHGTLGAQGLTGQPAPTISP